MCHQPGLLGLEEDGCCSRFEDVGRAVLKILEDPWGGAPIYLADGEQLARKEKGTVAGRDRRQLLEAAGLLGISAFATSLFGTFERMLGVGGEASNDVRTHVNTVTRPVSYTHLTLPTIYSV